MTLEQLLLIVAALLFLSVIASKASARLGVPALVLFIGIGMLAGSDGPGGIYFDSPQITQSVGTIALAFILFSGGLDTDWRQIQPVLRRGISLATLGVLITALAVAGFAVAFLDFTMLEGLLLGAIVSSTDAAAVFGVLRARSIALKGKLRPLLELESGSNDPMAVFLTIAFTAMLVRPGSSTLTYIPMFAYNMVLGLAWGGLTGYVAVRAINRARLEYDGLYPVLTITTVLVAYAGAASIQANGFLAVYVAGLVMGNHVFLHKLALRTFHDGLAWLMQIAVFLTLGLLVFPSQLPAVALGGLGLALFLVFVARPLAVAIALASARMNRKEKLLVSWVGLRGAVPIILATFPLIEGLPKSNQIFNLVFFVVLVSVVVQGAGLPWVARRLGMVETEETDHVASPGGPEAATTDSLMEVTIAPGAPAAEKLVVDLGLPSSALLVLLKRGTESYVPRGATLLHAGDTVLIATRKEDHDELRRLFEGPTAGVSDGR